MFNIDKNLENKSLEIFPRNFKISSYFSNIIMLINCDRHVSSI